MTAPRAARTAAEPDPLSPRRPLLGRSLAELEHWALAQGQPAFRGRQLHGWIYERGARDLAAITVLPKAWRQQLLGLAPPAGGLAPPASSSPASPAGSLSVSTGPARSGAADASWAADPDDGGSSSPETGDLIGRLPVLHRSLAHDGTVKLLLGTADRLSLETVGIPAADRLTVCVSSQVGCPMACRFCATGKGGLQRSLAVHEIVDQVLSVREVMQRRPSHVVFMGMGEPLLNIDAVLAAIDCLCRDLGMAQRQITVSTVGVPSALPTLAQRALERLGRAQFTLAVSLHAPDQALRQQLIPTARAYPIEALLEDCRHYVALTGRRVSFEYILLGGVNDQPRQAAALAARLRGFQSHVNLIPYNPIAEEAFRRPSPAAVEAFRRELQQRHIAVSVRASRGLDADAACGQLRRRLAEQAGASAAPPPA
ncbi:MAG: 23S rRNA (adenine(2503)-C(2))-methyltransferase RlmN [Cyanobium sp.]|jgi:23S rRNA (adenine2503-C2)-methyltransferase|nr:23S rRNA (adenine(2503)-C(2))-methyltransferase RlmN [Synechococcaceae cyanobacterium]